MPYVTGHKYKISFGNTGLNFENIQFEASERWEEADRDVWFVHNFSDVRVAIDVTKDNGPIIPNNTLFTSNSWETGDNVVYNDSEIHPRERMEVQLIVNGKGRVEFERRDVKLVGTRCFDPCVEEIEELPLEANFRYWSNPSSWESGALPLEGEDVHIKSGWNMVLDIPETPIMQLLRVNGRLSFQNDTDIHLRAKHIFVRAGELLIGAETAPF